MPSLALFYKKTVKKKVIRHKGSGMIEGQRYYHKQDIPEIGLCSDHKENKTYSHLKINSKVRKENSYVSHGLFLQY
jgi:hypothetical protein